MVSFARERAPLGEVGALEDWISLPRIAREIDAPSSTVRRWAAALDEFLTSRGNGAGRRFHFDAREVLRRAKVLYGTGLGAEQVLEVLRAEGPRIEDEGAAAPEAGKSPVSAIGREFFALSSLSAESEAPSTAQRKPAPSPRSDTARFEAALEGVMREIDALKQVIAKSAADQRRENARFRLVLGALVDLIEVQDQNRRLGMADKEKRDTHAQQRLMAGVQELLQVHREGSEEDAPEEPSLLAGARSRIGRRGFR
jgi:hypothetical protein